MEMWACQADGSNLMQKMFRRSTYCCSNHFHLVVNTLLQQLDLRIPCSIHGAVRHSRRVAGGKGTGLVRLGGRSISPGQLH